MKRRLKKRPDNVIFCISLFMFFFITACQPGKPTINKCWFYVYESNLNAHNKSTLTPASFLCIQKDGHYTCDFGVFDFGRWVYQDHKLILNSQRNQTTSLDIQSLKPNEMAVELEGEILNFDGQDLPSEDSSENPFSLANNEWRIPAAQRENEKALRRRLYDHCRFWEKYFTWAMNTNQNTIDVRSTPTPIKIYGNGFALKNVDDEPGRWKTYFYDEEDCKKANEILNTIISKHEISLAHTDNKYKMFIGAFQQLENILK